MIGIDKGIPIPEPKGVGRKTKYPLRVLDIGDSFFVPNVAQNLMTRCAYHIAKKTGREFTTRSITENGVRGVRVWRVK